MPITDIHNIYAIHVTDGATVNEYLRATEHPVDYNPEVIGEPNSGEVYPRCVYYAGQEPQARLTLVDIADALGSIGQISFSMDPARNTNAANLYGQKRLQASTRDGGNVHNRYGVTKGMIVPNMITVDRTRSSMTATLYALADGSNHPIVITEDVAVPDISAADNSYYGIGPITIGGVSLSGCTRLEIDFGPQVSTDYDGSETFPSFASIGQFIPRIRLQGSNLKWVRPAGTPLDDVGSPAVHADSSIYLIKRKCSNQFVDNATAEHIKFTIHGMEYPETILSGQGKTQNNIALDLAHDGTNLPIEIDLASAIP